MLISGVYMCIYIDILDVMMLNRNISKTDDWIKTSADWKKNLYSIKLFPVKLLRDVSLSRNYLFYFSVQGASHGVTIAEFWIRFTMWVEIH